MSQTNRIIMALPIDFITRTRGLIGDEFDLLERALKDETPVSIRVNRSKRINVPKGGSAVAWCDNGYYLPERLSFTFDPIFHAGGYYVQEASSMFLEQAIKSYIDEPVVCLDLCAAPGGKSTHLASLLPEGSLLVSNEVIKSRSYVLAENIAKWGRPDSVVLNNDPEEIGKALPHQFDVIVTDVPCSGEGMFRKDVDSTGEWSVDNVRLCASRSKRIIHDIWDALKPGGLLIYSTCTYNTEENEENVKYIIEELGAEALPITTKSEWQITGPLMFNNPVYRFFPHKTKGEGFFLAALRKADGEIREIRIKSKGKKEKGKAAPAIPSEAKKFLSDATGFSFEWDGSFIRTYPKIHSDIIKLITGSSLHPLSVGIKLCELKGKDLVPSQELALSTALNQEAFATTELSWDEAIKYLRKEAITLPTDIAKGYVLVRYKGLPLGFVKHLGNRANNLYPQEWRIRTSYLPEDIKILEQQ